VRAANATGGAALNTTPDDDTLFLRYDKPTTDAGTPIQEWIGAVSVYPRVDTRQPIDTSVTPKLFVLRLPAGGGPVTGIPVPADNVVVVPQFKDTSSDADANNDGVPDNQPLRGRFVVIRQTWLDENGDQQDVK